MDVNEEVEETSNVEQCDFRGLATSQEISSITENPQKSSDSVTVQEEDTPAKKRKTRPSKDRTVSLINELQKGRAERTALLRDLMTQVPKNQSAEETSDLATSMFFKSIATTVSTFPPILRAKVKLEIMNLVSTYEIEHATAQLNNTSAAPIHSVWPQAHSSASTSAPITEQRSLSSRHEPSTMQDPYESDSLPTAIHSPSTDSFVFSPQDYTEL